MESKTIFEYLQRKHVEKYTDGQLRTLQRRIKHWRATKWPAKEVFFPQKHRPGELSESDFTHISQWEKIFKDPMMTAAAIDRIVHHSVILELNISSYRMDSAKNRKLN